MRKDKANRFMKNIRGSPPYYQNILRLASYDPSAKYTHMVFHFISRWSEMARYDPNNSQAKQYYGDMSTTQMRR